MNLFLKIVILFITSVAILTPLLYYTIIWISKGNIVSGIAGSIFFMMGIWIFHKTLARIESRKEESIK